MQKVLVIAPHPDDETLGCGGTLLRHVEQGDEVSWLIMTTMKGTGLFTEERILSRDQEIQAVENAYNFNKVIQADFCTTELDALPQKKLISFISDVINDVQPEVVYLPYVNDVHSDHEAVFLAAASCMKSFRNPFVKSVRVYETLSETEFSLRTDDTGFRPNLWVDISSFLEKKIGIMRLYEGESGEHPFPRSEKNLRALATLRGATAGVAYAEAFMIIKEVIS